MSKFATLSVEVTSATVTVVDDDLDTDSSFKEALETLDWLRDLEGPGPPPRYDEDF